MAETSITIFSQCQLFNSFLPVFNMPGYTPNIFKRELIIIGFVIFRCKIFLTTIQDTATNL